MGAKIWKTLKMTRRAEQNAKPVKIGTTAKYPMRMYLLSYLHSSITCQNLSESQTSFVIALVTHFGDDSRFK
jgi:hypothetical protein